MISPDWHCDEYGKNLSLKKCFCVLHLSQLKIAVISLRHVPLLKQSVPEHSALKVFHKRSNALGSEELCEG